MKVGWVTVTEDKQGVGWGRGSQDEEGPRTMMSHLPETTAVEEKQGASGYTGRSGPVPVGPTGPRSRLGTDTGTPPSSGVGPPGLFRQSD